MEKITEMYNTLRKNLKKKMRQIVMEHDGKLTLTETQVKDIDFCTNLSVIEVGVDDNVSGGIYLKSANGCVFSFDILIMDNMYNLVSIIAR